MQCHDNCAACCIAPQITSALPNMLQGKPAGTACFNLGKDLRCQVYNDRPQVCRDFNASEYTCGNNHIQALKLLGELEEATKQ
jgi:Fe-S-cluster containining protein